MYELWAGYLDASKFPWMFSSTTTTVVAMGSLLVLNEINMCEV